MPWLDPIPEQPLEQPIRLPPVGAHVTIVSYDCRTFPGRIVLLHHSGDVRTDRTVLVVQIVHVSLLEGPGEDDATRGHNEQRHGR